MTQIMNLAQMHLGPEEPIVPLAYYEHPDYLSFMKNVENAARTGRNPNGVWFPHPSFEGGTPTMGYGHKMTNIDDYSSGLTDQQVNALLVHDLEAADARLRGDLGSDYNTLDDRRKQMLLDIVFNVGGLSKFPNFRKAVIDNDIPTMAREHHRFSGGQPLTRRNQLFAEYFGL